jgi:hypothetical protein
MKMDVLKNLIKEEIVSLSYELISENINPDDHYDFEHSRKNLWTFKDRKDFHHFIIIHKSLYKGEDDAEIKFGWIDDNKVKRYDKPPTYDERVFNTHIYILYEEILKYYGEYFDSFYLEANDLIRYRLYKMALNNTIDKSKYILEEVLEKNTIIIKIIK